MMRTEQIDRIDRFIKDFRKAPSMLQKDVRDLLEDYLMLRDFVSKQMKKETQ